MAAVLPVIPPAPPAPPVYAGPRVAPAPLWLNRTYAADDPQTWPIPKHIHFIWMGKRAIRGQVPPAQGQFMFNNVLKNVKANPECDTTLWVDAFTMATPDQLQLGVSRPTWVQYTQWQQLINSPEPPPGQAANWNRLRSKAGFPEIIALLYKTRGEWQAWFKDLNNQEIILSQFGRPLNSLGRAFDIQMRASQDNPIYGALQLRFLDTTLYPNWMLLPAARQERQLLNWVFMELYLRGSNFGAASDMLRIQILNDMGGVYVDHDDQIAKLHGTDPLPRVVAPVLRYVGFRYTYVVAGMDVDVPVNSFFATPAGHPFLAFYRRRMLDVYAWLLECDYKWLDATKKPMALRRHLGNSQDENWFQFSKGHLTMMSGEKHPLNFVDFTLVATGPDQLANSLIVAGNSHRISDFGTGFPQSAKQTGIGVGFSGAWV